MNQPQPSQGLERWKIGLIIGFCVLCAIIVVILLYRHKSTPDLPPANTVGHTTTFNPTQSPVLSNPTVLNTPPQPNNVSYQKLAGTGWWDGNNPGVYTCPKAAGSVQSGEAINACVFTNMPDLFNYCDNTPSCKGYVTNRDNNFQVTDNPVKSTNTTVQNAVYYQKVNLNADSSPRPYKRMDGNNWFTDGPSTYTCPNAKGVNMTGDYSNYCWFDKPEDAQAQCDKDSTCVGYGTDGNKFMVGKSWSNRPGSNTIIYQKL